MSLFKRSITAEICSHGGVVFSTLIVVWLSVLLVRLLGEAVQGTIGTDIVLGIAALSTITALPTILTVALFIAVLVTISRNYRESEMVVWFSSGQSILNWLTPISIVAIPTTVVIAFLSIQGSPWAYSQIEEYRQRFEQRSDFSKVAQGQFLETGGGSRVIFIESSDNKEYPMGRVFATAVEKGWETIITAKYARFRTNNDNEKFVDLGPGNRYDNEIGTARFRIAKFDNYTLRIESHKDVSDDKIHELIQSKLKARQFGKLLSDDNPKSDAQIMWRLSLPLAALNLALLAIPLGAVNPRLGRSLNLVIAGLIALFYMNLINLVRGWIANDQLNFMVGTITLNALASILCVYLFWRALHVKKPRAPRAT
ncbi:LPS export ABC transporter permease LptF [Brackiella oedipodis]|uniref:LPS export ABC transporter permease LptF n=1 Tax=Brackiella oedipodis TaxID=124225 RepID=UPI00048DB106|nr:LPS export ABC transporter permease LptF [Brackiella oedipodis]